MADNEETTNEGDFLLNRQAETQFSDDEKTEEASRYVQAMRTPVQVTPEHQAAYDQHVAQFGKKQISGLDLVDFSQPIGMGEGERNVRTDQDLIAGRMFAIDQGMADQDEAYSPTFESTTAEWNSSEYLNHAIAQVAQIDPELEYQLAMAERYMALFPEVAITTRNGFGFAGITEELMGEIIDTTSLAQAAGTFLHSSDTSDQFWSTYGKFLDVGTKDILTVSLAALSEKEQKHMAALSAAYIDARPLATTEDQMDFANWFYGESEQIYARENDQSFWGKFGRVGAHVFTNPANFLQDEILGSVWTSATDGADAWYRKDLTLEETMALSFGQDVGTTGWETFTGIAGAGIDIVIDPTNILLAGMSGLKMAKTAAMIDDFVTVSGKTRLIAHQAVPFIGGKKAAVAVGLPQGLRGRGARIAWTFFAKTQDGLVDTAAKRGIFDTLARATTYTEAIEKVPELKNAPIDLVDWIIKVDDPAIVQSRYASALKGDFLDQTSVAHRQLAEGVRRTSSEVNVHLSTHTDTLTAGDVMNAKGGDIFHAVPIQLEQYPTEIFDEAATALLRTQGNIIAQEGDTVGAIGTNVVRRSGDRFAVIDTNGNWVGGFSSAGGIAVAEDQRRLGVASSLLDIVEGEGIAARKILKESESVSGAAAKLLGVAPTQVGVKNVGRLAENTDVTTHFLRQGSTKVQNLKTGSKGYSKITDWVSKNTRFANEGLTRGGLVRKDALKAYMKAHNLDVIVIDGNVIAIDAENLVATGRLAAVRGGDMADEALSNLTVARRQAKMNLRVNAVKADKAGKWVISDMPMKVRSTKDDIRFWRNQFGVFSGSQYKDSSFLVRRLRGLQAKMFVDDVPQRIATGFAHRKEGAEDLRRLLLQMGVDPDFVRKSIDDYVEAPMNETVYRIIREAAEDVGDNEIALGLMRFNQKAANELEYAVINGGEQLTTGVSTEGATRLQPLMSSQLSDYVQLPDSRALSAHFRRIKRAQRRTLTVLNRGFGKTKAQRTKLTEGFAKQLKDNEAALATYNALSLEDKLAIAYAVVRPAGSGMADGLGYAGKMGQHAAEQWSRLRNVFSIAMLAWRPVGWMGNEMLDNAWRAAMADGLSFLRHPFAAGAGALDTARINRGLAERAAYLRHADEVLEGVGQAKDAEAVLDLVASTVPGIRKYVKTADTKRDQIVAVRRFLNDEIVTISDDIEILDNPLAKALYRQRKGWDAAKKYDLPVGKTGDLRAPDWDEVSVTGWEHQFAGTQNSASQRFEYQVGRYQEPAHLDGYVGALHSVLNRDVRSHEVRLYLQQQQHIINGGEDASMAARTYVNSSSHQRMREPIDNMLRGAGLEPGAMTDLEKVEWYFSNKISVYVDDVMGDLLDGNNVSTILSGKGTVKIGDELIEFDLDDYDSFARLVHAANGTDFRLPQSVVGVINPRRIYDAKGAKGWKTPLRSYNQWALNKFGHDIPVNLQRRPAFQRSYQRYRAQMKAMGMTDEAADIVAKQKAVKQINASFFFLEAQTPFLKAMNQIFPFFAAQWEVVKAWTWKVPTLSNYAGVGHARMLRSFDHVFTTLRNNGLLQPRYAQDGKVEGWDLQFAMDPETENAVGSIISKGAYYTLMAPSMFIEQVGEIFTQTDLDLTVDEVNFNFNHPYDFFGKRGGVMPTARMQMGLNPLMSFPASKLNEQLGISMSSEQYTPEEEQNLAVMLDEEEIFDHRTFLALNGAALVEAGALTEDELKRAQAGTYGLTNIDVPAGIDLYMPKRNLVGQFIDQVVFPYGQTDSIAESTSGFVPQILKNAFKSIALYQNDGDIDGLSAWMSPFIMGPTGRYGMGTAYNDAAAVLEMRTGIFTQRDELAVALAAAEPGSAEAIDLETQLHIVDDTITQEVRDTAVSRAFIQTIYGVALPFNPKMPTESQTLRSYYYEGKNAAEAWNDGRPVVMPHEGRNAKDVMQMIAAWATDDTGSMAKQEFLRQGGGKTAILAAIAPRTYWGTSGLPVQAQELQQYFLQVEAGDKKPLPLDVWSYRRRSLVIGVERDMAIIDEYGNDPGKQALAILANRAKYKDIVEEYDEMYRALDLEDEIVNDNAYSTWREETRYAESYVDFVANEEMEKLDNIEEAIAVVEADLFPEDPAAAKSTADTLKGIASTYYDIVGAYNDERYADWEVSPRQALMNTYYENLGGYYDELSRLFDGVAASTTELERSLKYSEIAQFRELSGNEPIYIGGVAYPPPEEYSWNGKQPEKQKAIIDAKLGDPLEWLSSRDAEHFVDVYPQAAPFMPLSVAARAAFDWKEQADASLDRAFGVGGQYEGESTKKSKDAIDEQFKAMLASQGEYGVLEAMENYPIENASAYGALPSSLEWMVGPSVAIHRQLTAHGKSPGTNDAKELQRWMFTMVVEKFETNPGMRNDFLIWGGRAFQEQTIEGIVAQMLGNYGGSLT